MLRPLASKEICTEDCPYRDWFFTDTGERDAQRTLPEALLMMDSCDRLDSGGPLGITEVVGSGEINVEIESLPLGRDFKLSVPLCNSYG